jgi:hypothetical protein
MRELLEHIGTDREENFWIESETGAEELSDEEVPTIGKGADLDSDQDDIKEEQ